MKQSGGKSYREIGRILGISHAMVIQIERQAIRKLRMALDQEAAACAAKMMKERKAK